MSTPAPNHSISLHVVDRPERSRFELLDEDDLLLGYADYHLVDSSAVMPHTVIDPQYRGRGLGDVLVIGAVQELHRRGLTVVGQCWFVADVLQRHPELTAGV